MKMGRETETKNSHCNKYLSHIQMTWKTKSILLQIPNIELPNLILQWRKPNNGSHTLYMQ